MKLDFVRDGVEAVHATISYADVFDMPISRQDLHQYLVGVKLSRDEVDATVDELVAAGTVSRVDDLIFLSGRDEVLAVHRDRASRSVHYWAEAHKWIRRVARLPFIRMIAVTGGLAVDSVADHDDIDLFIVVAPGRLWLTRLSVIAVGKLAERAHIELCPNFIVSTDALEMSVRSVYVARELAQMKAIVGDSLCQNVRRRNDWMFEFLPNATIEGDRSRVTEVRSWPGRGAVERLLALAPFQPLEDWERNRKIAKLMTVRSRRPEVGAPDESSFSPDICKGHMVGNAAGIEHAWRARMRPEQLELKER